MAVRGLFLAVLLVLWPSGARGQDDTDPYEFEVVGDRDDSRDLRHAPGLAVRIDTAAASRQTTSVAELLRSTAGVSIRSLGGLGDFATVSLRGAAANQVTILLDGIPLNTAGLSVVNVNLISPDLLQSIDVYRSGAPIWLGASPMGGLINLRTRDAEASSAPTVTATAGYGSFATRRASLFVDAPLAPLVDDTVRLLIGGSYFGSEGDFDYFDDRGTPLNPDDDRESTRQNNRANGGNILFRVDVRPGRRGVFSVLQLIDIDRRGVPGLGQNQSGSANSEDLRSITQGTMSLLAVFAREVDAHIRMFVDVLSQNFADPDGEIGLGRREVQTFGVAGGLQLHFAIFPNVQTEVHAVADQSVEVVTTDALSSTGATRFNFRPSVEWTQRLVDDRLRFMLGARLDWSGSDFGPGTQSDPDSIDNLSDADTQRYELFLQSQAGLGWFDVDDAERELIVQATFGRYARVPTFLEMFGDSGAVVGNPNLVAESTWAADVSAELRRRSERFLVTGTTAAFFYSYDDLIQFVQNSQYVARPENIAAAIIAGAELSVGLQLSHWAHVNTSYTYTYSEDHSGVVGQDGNPLAGRPPHVVNVEVGGAWEGLELGYSIDVDTGNVFDRAGFKQSPDRHLHSAHLSWTPHFADSLTLSADAYNLLDQRVADVPVLPAPPGSSPTAPQALSDYLGFPLPGRSFFVTLQWRAFR